MTLDVRIGSLHLPCAISTTAYLYAEQTISSSSRDGYHFGSLDPTSLRSSR